MANFCAIDVGSNAIRIVFASKHPNGSIEQFASRREPIRLGAETFGNGEISDVTVSRLVETFARFRDDIERYEVDEVRAVATSALREAKNGKKVCKQVKAATGIKLKIISGVEEGRLVHLAVQSVVGSLPNAAMIDIGGGSVEVGLLDHGGIRAVESLKLGTVRLLTLLGNDSSDPTLVQKRIESYVDGGAHQANDDLRASNVDVCVGTGGNFECMLDLRKELCDTRDDLEISIGELEEVYEQIGQRSVDQRREDFGLRSDRADVILPATALALAFMRDLNATKLVVPGVGLKEGVLIDMANKSDGVRHKARRAQVLSNVRGVAEKFGVDMERCEVTRNIAVTLYDEATVDRTREERLLVEVSCLMLDIGRFLDARAHHKHSAYIIENMPIVGLSKNERRIVAALARYHRKSMPKQEHVEVEHFNDDELKRLKQLITIIRVANAASVNPVAGKSTVTHENDCVSLQVPYVIEPILAQWSVGQQLKLWSRFFTSQLQFDWTIADNGVGASK